MRDTFSIGYCGWINMKMQVVSTQYSTIQYITNPIFLMPKMPNFHICILFDKQISFMAIRIIMHYGWHDITELYLELL